MKASGMRTDLSLENAYRATFEKYARRLDAFQSLIAQGVQEGSLLEAALFEVEKARLAHSCARDRLAAQLAGPTLLPAFAVGEHQIRETAQLLWELAGRPEGTAEGDWHRAEQLVHRAAAGIC